LLGSKDKLNTQQVSLLKTLTLDSNSIVSLCRDASNDIPTSHFSFTPISSINECKKDVMIDVLGIIISTGELTNFTSKAGKELKRRNITLLDDSSASIEYTLWGDKAEGVAWSPNDNPIVAIKAAKVSDYNNRTISSTMSTQFTLNPELPEARKLKGWWEEKGRSMTQVNSLTRQSDFGGDGTNSFSSETKTFAQVKGEAVGIRDQKGSFFEVKATITMIKSSDQKIWYEACPTLNCNKKVTQSTDGKYQCQSCRMDHDTFTPRYVLPFTAADQTGSQWLSCFNDVAERILGISATDLMNENSKTAELIFSRAVHKQYRFKIKAREETYNEQWKLKCIVIQAIPIDFVKDSSSLITQIQNLRMS